MPTKNLRIQVDLERPLFQKLKGLAKKKGFSISLVARELIREGVRSTGKGPRRPYTGKYTNELTGRFHMGKKVLDKIFEKQFHG